MLGPDKKYPLQVNQSINLYSLEKRELLGSPQSRDTNVKSRVFREYRLILWEIESARARKRIPDILTSYSDPPLWNEQEGQWSTLNDCILERN